jgi:hypothetical protein
MYKGGIGMRTERSWQSAEFLLEDHSPDYLDLTPLAKLPLRYNKEAKLLGHFCNLVIRRLASCHSKVEEWKLVVKEYNSGVLAPDAQQTFVY